MLFLFYKSKEIRRLSFYLSSDTLFETVSAGSITTLVHIVDENGGFTIIPEMHLPFLSNQQRENVRPIEGNYLSQRRISLYIKEDYIRQRMLNTITDTLKKFMPKGMLNDGIVKYGIKL